MSHRALLRDIACRNTFICQSCRSSLGGSAPRPWPVRHSSRVAQLGARPRSSNQNAPRSSRSPTQTSNHETKSSAAASLLQELTAKRNKEPTVRFFEKDESGELKPLQGEDAYTESLGGLKEMEQEFQKGFTADMRRTLSKIQDMGAMKGFGIENMDAVAEDFEKQFEGSSSPDDMITRLDDYIKDLESQLAEKGMDVTEFDDSNPVATMGVIGETTALDPSQRKKNPPIPQIPEKVWSFNQRKRIIRLNALLSRTTKEIRRGEELTVKTVQSVWKCYNTTRPSLAKAWANVPQDVWDLLWTILSLEDPQNSSRLTYLSLLARDLSEAKVALNPSQQLVTVEAMFMDGWDTKAIDNWKRCMTTLGDSGADTFQQFWELGVRMFCQKGDLVQAERAVNKLLERQLDPRILVPFVQACAANPAEETKTKAWDAYRRMRDLLGPSMGLEDYDQVISFFLTTNQTERALHAFVDMMTSGTVDMRGRDQLPSQIGNKFFFGKWLKRLIGAGDLDGAYSVFTFMRSKGIEAAAVQINGLIGAWHRSGGADYFQKADDLAWEMINARIEFVHNRRRLSSMEGRIRLVQLPGNSDLGAMPKATLETFCLLAENYRLRQMPGEMMRLWDAFKEAEISPDAFMMNQLIELHSQSGEIAEARELYQNLVYDRHVKPDPHTFMAMWKMLGINRLHSIADDRHAEEVKMARDTFAEMVRFAGVFKADGLDGQLARKILHTFRRLKDKLGIIITLRAFKEVFDFSPPEVLVLEMLMETTNLAWDTPTARQRLRLMKRRMDTFIENRPREPGEPRTLDEMKPQQRGEELSRYMQAVYSDELGEIPHEVMGQVAEQMGVYDVLVAPKA